MAINPQILKRNAAGEIDSYKQLLLWSANISYYLMLLFVLPLFFSSDFVLKIWLKDVPPFTSPFLQIALLEMLVYVYDITFYQIFQAEGRLKENAIICPIMDIVGLAIVYFVYLLGGSVLAIAWMMLLLTAAQGMLVKPWLAIRFFGYKWSDFLKVFLNNFKVTIVALIFPLLYYIFVAENSTINYVVIIGLSILAVLFSSFYIGMSRQEREKVINMVKLKIQKK